ERRDRPRHGGAGLPHRRPGEGRALRPDPEPLEARQLAERELQRGLPLRVPGDPQCAPRRRRAGCPRRELRPTPVHPPRGGLAMPSWSLKVSATFITLFVLAGSFDYARGHVKNPNAPLQPPVADKPAAASAAPTASAAPSVGPLFTLRPGQRPATITPGPRLTLAPGVVSATLPPISFTHTS